MTYAEQLKSPKWQRKRLQVFERDKFTCQICDCGDDQLQVHHKSYDSTYQTKAWEYPDHIYQTLCCICHKELTDHIKLHGDDKEFSVYRVKRAGNTDAILVYSKGILTVKIDGETVITFSENATHKIVQFLINNWCKNG